MWWSKRSYEAICPQCKKTQDLRDLWWKEQKEQRLW